MLAVSLCQIAAGFCKIFVHALCGYLGETGNWRLRVPVSKEPRPSWRGAVQILSTVPTADRVLPFWQEKRVIN